MNKLNGTKNLGNGKVDAVLIKEKSEKRKKKGEIFVKFFNDYHSPSVEYTLWTKEKKNDSKWNYQVTFNKRK